MRRLEHARDERVPGGDLVEAQRWYEQAIAAARAIGDDERVARTLMSVGRFVRETGDLVRSRELLEESLAVSRAVGNEVDVAWILKELAMTAVHEGAFDDARQYLIDGFEGALRLGLTIVLGDLVFAVALLAARIERPRDGAVLFGAVDGHDERLGFEHTPELTWWWELRTELMSALGEPEFEALAAEGRALELDAAIARARVLLATLD